MAEPFVRASVDFPGRNVDVHLELAEGERLGLIGPNGAGKSTVLKTLAGLLSGPGVQVRVGTHTWEDGVRFTPAHQRSVGYLAQDPLLFPHLTCLDNVAFGLRARGMNGRQARGEAHSLLERVGAGAWVARYPHQLSGGQAARVALARAVAPEPELVLLDEPFAALDVDSAVEVRDIARALLDGRTTILAAHDVHDIAALTTHTCVIVDGRVVESAATPQVLVAGRSDFAQQFADRIVIPGTVVDGVFHPDEVPVARIPVSDAPDGPGRISFAPHAWRMATGHSGHDTADLCGTVIDIRERGSVRRIYVRPRPSNSRVLPADVELADGSALRVGGDIALHLDRTRVRFVPDEPGR